MTAGALIGLLAGLVSMWLLGPGAGLLATVVVIVGSIALGHGVDRARRERRGEPPEGPRP